MKRLYTLLVLFAFSGIVSAQVVKGRVTAPDNSGLPGVIVKDQVSGAGAATDIDGNFSLTLEPGDRKIEFTMLGYATQVREIIVKAGETTDLNVKMEDDITMADEVLVVGYGVQRKRDITGAIARVEGREITRFPTPSFESALQGQAAGVQVSQGSGLAGSGALVRIRGIASVSAGGDPLYVVDGIPITQDQFLNTNSGAMNTNPLATINPNDIESVEVLKDAAATGIYGSRGANGVVLITTKRGSKKGLEVSYAGRLGVGTAASLPNMLNTDQYLAIRQEAWENDGGTGYVWLPNLTNATSGAAAREAAFLEAQKTNTDWVKETTGLGFKTMHSVGINTKTDRNALYAGLTYDYNGSYLLGNSYTRMSARANWDHTFSDHFKIMLGASFTRGINERINAAWSGGLGEAMSTALPYYKVYNDDGSYYTWNNGYSNPVMYREERPWRYYEDRVLITTSFIYTPIRDLNFRLNVNADGLRGADYQFYPRNINNDYTTASAATASTFFVPNANANLTVDYTRTLKENHNVSILAGTEAQESRTYNRYEKYFNAQGLWVNTSNRTGENDSTIVARDPNSFYKTTETNRSIFMSVFGRVNYNYKRKYYAQVVARADGSSKFGPNKKVGFFPGVSAGWVISEEGFLSENKVINFLKLRAGIGLVGNSNISQNAQFADRTVNGAYNQQPILYTTKLPNPNLHWESTTTYDLGIDFGLWKDRINGSLEFYRKQTTEAILDVSLPQSTGFSTYTDNVAEILNQGVELTLNSYNISRPDVEWKTTLILSRNYNELQDIGKYTPDAVSGGTNDSRVIVGKPIGSFYLMQWSHVDPVTGRPVYLDRNGNETFDYDNFQRQFAGTGLPKLSGGFNNNVRYKQWSLGVFATFSLGAKIFDSSGKRQMGVVTDWNMRTEILDRWRQPGDDATFAGVTLDETNYDLPSGFPWWNTSLFVYKADYLRLKNIEVGYTFNLKPARKITSLRLLFNVTNLFTITNFHGLDPEIVRDFENPQDRNMSPNITYLTPPQERSYNLSVQAVF